MLIRLVRWFFRTVTPYVLGMLLGIGFFVALIRFLDAPGGLLQATPGIKRPVEYLTGVVGKMTNTEETAEWTENSKIVGSGGDAIVPPSTGDGTSGTSGNTGDVVDRDDARKSLAAEVSNPSFSGDGQKKTVAHVKEPTNGKNSRPGMGSAGSFGGIPSPPTLPSRGKIEECGVPPDRPGVELERYASCQWRRNCLLRMDNFEKMIARGLKECPENTSHAQICRSYYHSLQMQVVPHACDYPWPGSNRP